MSRQLQTWFFDGTPGPTSDVFLTGGFPTQDTFQNLVDSVPFFEDPDSSASLLQQGLVMMTTDTNALSRASAATGAMTTMIQPHQLPMMLSEILVPNNNPALAPVPASVLSEIGAGAYGTYKGILTRGVSQTVASITRLDYQLEFDPSSLPVVTVEPTNYDGVIFDYADSTAKRINRSIFNGGNILWEEEGGLFVCLSALPTQFKNFIQFDPAGAGAEIYPADNTGAGIPMYIRGGSAAGGTGNLGGNLYLYGGSGIQGGNPGNVSICYNGSGSSNTGWLGVGCAAANGYQLKVCGNVLITGTLTVQGTGGPGIAPGGGPALTMVLGVDNTGVMSTVTPGNMMNLLINTVPSTKGIVHYNGTAYALMPAPPTGLANQYVWYDANGNLGLTPLTYSVAITAANLASGFTLTSDQITVGTQTLTAYITNLALSISALGNNVSALAPNINTTTTLNGNAKVNASALYQTYLCNSSNGSFSIGLCTGVPTDTMLTFTQIGTNTVTITNGDANNIVDLNSTGTPLTSITIGTNGNSVSMVFKSGTWVIVKRS